MPPSSFPIVGIGASAGGLDAFHSFFDHMPTACGMAFVVIMHLPADRKSLLPKILGRWTAMRVVEAAHGTPLEPDVVYVPLPHSIVTIDDGRLGVATPEGDDGRVLHPIDRFFDSLAAAQRERAVGIVLSGTGSDGALGLKAIKECGGLTIAQGSDGTAPQYGDMPAGAIATGAVDLVAPIDDIPSHLLRMRQATPDVDPGFASGGAIDAARLRICDILRTRLGHDFSGYRDQTFLRRVARRMQVVGALGLAPYIERLQADPNEVVLLFRDLLIRVTSFFRDKETFAALETTIIPRLFEGKHADGAVRVWVPGCATGEEAYSLAMLLRESMDQLRGAPKVQIFATDIDDAVISTARAGRYPTTLLEALSTERRNRFFSLSQGSYVVKKEIRELCTFSTHNLVREPPFSRMNLVSCRNLLIYMERELQARVIPAFHYALVPGGILLLGGSESASQHQDLFEPVDKAARIFRRRDVRSPSLTLGLADGILSAWPIPPAAVPRSGEAAQARSPPGNPGEPPAGAAARANPPLPGPTPGRERPLIERLRGTLFPSAQHVTDLERHAAATREHLQSLTEEHQTALEELRSANEELHSVNEEMQSTNEELETSKEELQSLNEELHTVNQRLTEKVQELDQTNSDLRNLFDSTEIATIFLDRHLLIRSFTPAVATLYNLIPSDQGRPLTDIVSRLNYAGLREDVASVLNNLEPLERRIARVDRNAHFIMRILPYREPDSTVSGVLVTFVDVTTIVAAEAALVEADIRKDVFLAMLSHELRNPLAPIRTAARLLQSPDLEPAQLQRAQAIISRQVSHMSSLLDDLLDVARITRGAFHLKKEYVDVRQFVEAAVEAVQPAIDEKRHRLELDLPAAPVIVEADAVRLTQVISNLLTNAVKYTAPGGNITLTVRRAADGLAIGVRDTGIGLSPDMLTQVFDLFTRVAADSPIARSESGLGIGLSLAKGLIELHGGHIEARSPGLGRGCEFVVTLPASLIVEAPAPRPQSAAPLAEPLPPRRVLVADDNRDGAETLGMFLNLEGHEVHLAFSGGEALEAARKFKPDVAVLDIGMPDVSGYDVAHRIRLEAWGQGVTLIALTGWAQDEDKRRAKVAGFDHHLTKPVDPEELERLLCRAPGR